ncbi:Leucine-rich repeat-containing protein [Cynara cardunculus var. scolymus]|uniref:non-specific serine/threonine protein kinase n=1 Tax=Cynara cardunculus var. scolymus TaxID=59895 RepID=A0A103Y3L5_CYNCS|nr:Leucine-rich repeat-containing protein [Cynara cardunculus var. scolymus]
MSSEPISGHHLVLLSLLCLVCHSSSQSDQLQPLLKFKSALSNSNSQVFKTWNGETPICNFTGIVCGSDDSVKEINLSQQQLVGTLPFDSICSLQSLEKISLGTNLLYGNISNHLSNCTHLQYLDLGQNFFSGEVPDLSPLTQLKFLNLNLSGFSGKFPWKSLENLTGLAFLSLGDNPFDKSPFPLEVLKLQKLYSLYLSNCSIEGKIPEEIGNLTLLESFELSDNYLVGEIPVGITKLTKLQMLELYNNELSGILPGGFRNLVNLSWFDVSNNSLEGDLSELRSLTKMESLQLFENSFHGTIPEEFGEFKFLTQFSIYDNKFTGELPARIGSWANFQYIDVSENFLTGSIPPDMCKMGKMEKFLMLENNFTGGLPENYAGCSSLLRLRVSNNSLSGRVPDGIWSLPNLRMIDLALNQFEGQVPPNIGEAKSLAQLLLGNNQFSGELPEEITKVTSLVEIELLSNQFSGKIPSRIGELKKLSNLHLQDNIFSGAIPESLGSCTSLDEINLAGNSLSDQIPASLGSLPSLNSLNLSTNKLSGEIPASLSSLKLSLIDLSNNMLIGRVPQPLILMAYSDSFAGNPGLCADGRKDLRPCSPVSHKSGQLKVAVYCFIAGAVVLLLSLSGFLIVKLRQNDDKSPMNRGFSWDVKQFHVLKISEDEVIRSLKQENIIGKGGSGNVYKVVLRCGEQLAVKHMWKSEPDSGSWRSSRSSAAILPKGKSQWREYEAEVAALSSLRHMNVVKLYCSITSEDSNLLVYEYMPNGSLWDRLHTYQKIEMDWNVRYDIAVGAARGLEYLHHACDRPVIHRDVKSSNILLDEEMKPKISDFGLAKIVQTGKAMDSSHVIAGTYEDAMALVDCSITKDAQEEAVEVLSIAVHCTMKVPALRPSMRMVVKMLEEIEPKSLAEIVIDKKGENGNSYGKS